MGDELREAGGLMARIWVEGFDEIVALFDSYRAADKRLNRFADQLNSICVKETASFSTDPRGGSCDVPELQRYVEHRETVREQMVSQLERISRQFDRIVNLTNQLAGIEHQVITRYYIMGHPMHKVASDVNHSVRQCWRLRDDAFYSLAQKDGTT